MELWRSSFRVDGENAFADVQTRNLRVSTGSLQVVLDTLLPAFPLIDKIGSTEIRHSVKIPYGILNKDARVTIEIRDSSGAHVATLLKDELVKAHSGVRAHSVIWNGMDDKNKISVDPGKYTVVITALPDGVSDTTQRVEARASLPVVPGGTMVDVTPGDRSHTDSVSIYVSEAVIDSSSGRKINRYEPIADFFVEAELKGKYLPENVRNAELVTEFGGKQHPLKLWPDAVEFGAITDIPVGKPVYVSEVRPHPAVALVRTDQPFIALGQYAVVQNCAACRADAAALYVCRLKIKSCKSHGLSVCAWFIFGIGRPFCDGGDIIGPQCFLTASLFVYV